MPNKHHAKKSKPVTQADLVAGLILSVNAIREDIVTHHLKLNGLNTVNNKHCAQINALEDAICPRVAARLAFLERRASEIDALYTRLLGRNVDVGVLNDAHNELVDRVYALEQGCPAPKPGSLDEVMRKHEHEQDKKVAWWRRLESLLEEVYNGTIVNRTTAFTTKYRITIERK